MSDELPRAAVAPEERPVLRAVQRTGRSSLAVTLPKAWTESFNIHNGTLVRLHDIGRGRLEVSPAARTVPDDARPPLPLDATGCPARLVSRLLVGAYVTGQDHIVITSAHELSRELRTEVGRTAQRVLGMSVVEDGADRLEVRVFLDPSKHRLAALLDRVVRMIRLEVELCLSALGTGDPAPLSKVRPLHDEIDRFYLLMARQILLASRDFQVAQEIGVPRPHDQLGYRVVVKMLEVTGGELAKVASELGGDLGRGHDTPEIRRALVEFDAVLVQTMEAFREVSAPRAFEALIALDSGEVRPTGLARPHSVRGRAGTAPMPRILAHLGTARGILAIVNETTIDRAVESETLVEGGSSRLSPPRIPEPPGALPLRATVR